MREAVATIRTPAAPEPARVVAVGEHERRGAVEQRRAVEPAQRVGGGRRVEHVLGTHRFERRSPGAGGRDDARGVRRLEHALPVEQLGLERGHDGVVGAELALEVRIEGGELDRMDVALGLLGVGNDQVQVLVFVLHARERVAEAQSGVGRDLRLRAEHAADQLVDAHARDRAAVPEVLAGGYRTLDLRERCPRVLERRLDGLPRELGDAHVVAAGRGSRFAHADDPGVGCGSHRTILPNDW